MLHVTWSFSDDSAIRLYTSGSACRHVLYNGSYGSWRLHYRRWRRDVAVSKNVQHFRRTENWGPFWGGRAGSPSNTMSSGPRSASFPSGILIQAAVWPQ